MASDVHRDLLSMRPEYPVLQRSTYLVNNSLGAMHRGTRDRLAEYADLWDTHGVVAWKTWIAEMRRVGDQVAELIGAPPGTVVMRQSVADLLGTVASAIDWSGSRNRVVYSDLEWPSSHYLWTEHVRHGAELVVVPGESDGACNGDPPAGQWWPEYALGLAQRTKAPGVPLGHKRERGPGSRLRSLLRPQPLLTAVLAAP